MKWLQVGLCLFALCIEQQARAETNDPQAAAPTDAQFAFVDSFHGRTLWISHTRWRGQALRSRPKWLNDDTAFANVAGDSLPDSLHVLAQQTVSLFDATGRELCQAKLQRWGVVADYNQGDDNWADLSKQTLLKRMYAGKSDARRRYAVELEVSESCARARWARVTSLPPAAVLKVTALAGKALLAERARFRSTPEWVEAQTRFGEENKGLWDEHADTHVHACSCQLRGEQFVFATLFQFNDCESFAADLVLTFRGRGKQAVQLPNNLSVELVPELALDLNLDGTPEWLTSDSLIGWDGERFMTVIDNASMLSSCPC